MKKIILFGGSFDPIHYGHYNMAQKALKQRRAFELWFIPNLVSPFKNESSNFEHRVKMIEMMISGNSKMKVCTVESTLEKPSYSMNTIDKLKVMHPEYEFEWLIGDDQIENLHKWYDYERLKKEVQFIVYQREQSKHEFPSVIGDIRNVSSTAIRQGTQFDTKPSILEYFMRHGLYLDEMTKHRLSAKRYEHTLRVCDLALEIGESHHINEDQIRLATMMHDYCKEDYSDVYYKKLDVPKAFNHGFAAASFLSLKYYIKDRAVLRAISNHVSGDGTHPLAMLLFVADKCERGRGYDSEPLIQLAKKDLRLGFKKCKEESNKYRKEAQNGTIRNN